MTPASPARVNRDAFQGSVVGVAVSKAAVRSHKRPPGCAHNLPSPTRRNHQGVAHLRAAALTGMSGDVLPAVSQDYCTPTIESTRIRLLFPGGRRSPRPR